MSSITIAKSVGGSMYPVLDTGDEMVIKRGEAYKPGDIIVFHYKGYYLAHRVIKTKPRLITKGDNTPQIDEFCFTEEDVIGVVKRVYKRKQNRWIDLDDYETTNRRYVKYALLEMKLIKIFGFLSGKDKKNYVKGLLQPLYYGKVARVFKKLV